MSPKEYMAEADRLHRRIERKENEIRTLRASAEGMMGAGNNDMPKSDSKNLHKMESAVCKIIALQEEVSGIRLELDTLMNSMRERINAINNYDVQDLLIKRYIEFKPWKIVANELYISERQAYYLHREALEFLE